MIGTSALFSQKIAESSRQFRARLLYDGAAISGEIRNITINKGACGESFSIGSIYSSYIEVTLDSCEELLENKELLLQIGLVIDDTVEYIDMGYYTVTKPSRSIYQTTFTAVGRITSKLNKLFDVPAVLTLRNIANAITAATGVTIIFNGEVSDAVLAKDITGMTCKEALSVIVGTFGGFATEDNSGNIVVSKYVTTSKVSVDGDRMTALPELNDLDYNLYGIKVVVSAAGEDEDGNAIEEVAFTAGAPRLTVNNEFMTADLFESFVANTVGYEYRPGTVPLALGDPRLQPWDCLEVMDINENVYIVPCLNIVHTFDGGLTTTITAPGESESESSSYVAGPMAQQIERLYYELLTAKEAIIKRLKADDLEAAVAKLGYASVKELEAINGKVEDLFAEDITATGNFNLGKGGALAYDAETDTISIGASKVYLDSKVTIEKALQDTQDAAKENSEQINSLAGKVPTKTSQLENDSNFLTSEELSGHNTNTEAHNDIRLLIEGLTTRLNTLADSDDTTLDQMSELVAYIKSNRSLIEEVTTNKVNVSDIVNNLTTPVANYPLSANQGVVLKGLIDALQEEVNTKIPTKVSDLENDSAYIKESSVINNLTTDTINEPLAAKQGKVLKELIDKVEKKVPTKTSDLTNNSGFLTSIPDDYVTETELLDKGYLTEVPSEYVTRDVLSKQGYMVKSVFDLGLYNIVKTVNNLKPDANGNVDIVGEDGSLKHTHTWADIAQGSTFAELVITSDGIVYDDIRKVSDEAPALEYVQKGFTLTYKTSDGLVTEAYPGDNYLHVLEVDNGIVINLDGYVLVVIAHEDGMQFGASTYAKGTHFCQDSYFCVQSFACTVPGVGATPIPVEYLPVADIKQLIKEVIAEIIGTDTDGLQDINGDELYDMLSRKLIIKE